MTANPSRLRLAGAAALLALLTAAAASAEPEQAVAGSATLDEVVITGSRIAVPNALSTSPIQVVAGKEFEQGGKTDVIDLLNQLPQNFQNSSSDFSNTSSGLSTPGGISTADLRGLGPQRTLVLVNGRRLGTGDPNTGNPNSAPDLDQIPVALVERVEVVTGGASATYGSDAIAGVVNFIMRRNFDGVQFEGQLGEYWHDNGVGWTHDLQRQQGYDVVSGTKHDGQDRSFSLLFGTNLADGKGNVTGYLTYLHANPITSGDRDFGACQLNLNAAKTGVTCGGSANSNWFGAPDGTVYSVVGNQFLPWPQAGSNPPALFNSQRYIFASRGDQRYNAGLLAHVELSEAFKPYAEFGFMNDRTNVDVAPSGLFQSNPLDPTGNGNFLVNCSNPLLSAQEAAALCTPAQIAADSAVPGSVSAAVDIGRRNVEGGGRQAYFEHTNYRAVVGAKGEFATAWNYDVYGSYYYTTLFNSNSNYLNFASVASALQVTTGPNGPVCVSGPPCVPWNIFRDGGVTPDQLSSLYTTGTSYGASTERILHADITGDLGKYGVTSPLARDGLAVNVGAEHRNDNLSFAPDSAELSGLLSGFSGASVAIDNGVTVDEAFAELRAPLVQDRPGAKDLTVDTGIRHSSYNLAGSVNTYKFELQFAPLSDVRFRGSYQRAIRAPNVIELFTPDGITTTGAVGIDPCAPTKDPNTGVLTPATASLADCLHTGVTAAEYGNGGSTNTIKQCTALQCSAVGGGNMHLKPERSDSITFGTTLTPAAAPGLAVSIDYWRINLTDVIGTASAPIALQKCLTLGDPADCNLIVRTPGGSLAGSSVQGGGYFLLNNVNIGAAAVSGIDLQAAYRLPLRTGWGSLSFSLAGSEMLKNSTTLQAGQPSYDCTGLYGQSCQTVNPRWRHNLRVLWQTPWEIEVAALWRYLGSVRLDSNSSDPTLSNGKFDAFDARLPNISFFDLSASWNVGRGFQLRAGINNVFDKDPPIVSANVVVSGAANSLPTYDQLGRQVFIAFSAKR